MNVVQALVWNVGTCRLDVKGEAQVEILREPEYQCKAQGRMAFVLVAIGPGRMVGSQQEVDPRAARCEPRLEASESGFPDKPVGADIESTARVIRVIAQAARQSLQSRTWLVR